MTAWRVRRWLFWSLVLVGLYFQVRQMRLPFDPDRSIANIKFLLKHGKPKLGGYAEQSLDRALLDWGVTGRLRLTLPPQYTDSPFANAGFLLSFINHGETILCNGPYPHPKLDVIERVHGTPPRGGAYHFHNQSTNAALLVRIASHMWPLGYTAWYDLVTQKREIIVRSPRLVDDSGTAIAPTAVRAVHSLNQVQLDGAYTRMALMHVSPIVWTFPTGSHLETKSSDFAMETALDGAEVSWLPPLPKAADDVLGMATLSPIVPNAREGNVPEWWRADEGLRRAIVTGAPSALRSQLLFELTRLFPLHPLLSHYRVISRLGTPEFDDSWIAAQKDACDLPTWYLVAWTHLPWSRVQKLPCVTKGIPAGGLDEAAEYIAESVVFAYRDRRDDPILHQLATRAIAASYLKTEYRGFNYLPSDFAWLLTNSQP